MNVNTDVPRGDPLAAPLAQMARIASRLWERGWGECNAGNLSWLCEESYPSVALPARVQAGADIPLDPVVPELAGRVLLVTATGARMRDIGVCPARHIAALALHDGGRLAAPLPIAGEASPAPTSEMTSHLAVHASLRRRQARERAVVHTHPDELIVLSHDPSLQGSEDLTRRLWRMIPEALYLLPEGVGLVPYQAPGSRAQGAATAAALERHPIAVWSRHGAVATGEDMEQAFDRIDAANKAAHLYLEARRAGFEPAGLSDAQVTELRRVFFGS